MTDAKRFAISANLQALGWLLVLHALADVLVGVYRCLNLDPGLTDTLCAALTRSQVCLLALWFGLGREPWSWRLCGLVAGCCFLFSVMSGLAMPGQWDWARGAVWFEEEWTHYFRPAGAGDVMIKSPVMIPVIAVPLLIWRTIKAVRSRHQAAVSWRSWIRPEWFRFRFQDLAVWSLTFSLVLVVIFQTAPYESWFAAWFQNWLAIYRWENAAYAYAIASSLLYAWVAFVALWTAWGRTRLGLRITISLALVILPAIVCQWWMYRAADAVSDWEMARRWFQATNETATAVLAWLLTVGSLALYQLYLRATEILSSPRPKRSRQSSEC